MVDFFLPCKHCIKNFVFFLQVDEEFNNEFYKLQGNIVKEDFMYILMSLFQNLRRIVML